MSWALGSLFLFGMFFVICREPKALLHSTVDPCTQYKKTMGRGPIYANNCSACMNNCRQEPEGTRYMRITWKSHHESTVIPMDLAHANRTLAFMFLFVGGRDRTIASCCAVNIAPLTYLSGKKIGYPPGSLSSFGLLLLLFPSVADESDIIFLFSESLDRLFNLA